MDVQAQAAAPSRRTDKAPAPLVATSVGEPQRLSSLARLLLQIHQRPPLKLVHDQQSHPVPAQLEGSK